MQRIYTGILIAIGAIALISGIVVAVVEGDATVLVIVGALLFALPFLVMSAREIQVSWGNFAATFTRISNEVADVEERAKSLEQSAEASELSDEIREAISALTDEIEQLQGEVGLAAQSMKSAQAFLPLAPTRLRRRRYQPYRATHVPDVEGQRVRLALKASTPVIFVGAVVCDVTAPNGTRHVAFPQRDPETDQLVTVYPDDFSHATPLGSGNYSVHWYELPPTADELRASGGREIYRYSFTWPPPSLEDLLDAQSPP